MKRYGSIFGLICLIAALLIAVPAGADARTPSAALQKALTRVDILPKTVSVFAGSSLQLRAAVYPQKETGTASEILWASESPEIVSVDENGLVTGLAVGRAFVRATHRETGKFSRRAVTVKGVRVARIIFPESAVVLDAGAAYDGLKSAQVLPENATNKRLRFSSSNDRVATVDEAGAVTAIKAGDAVIFATADGKRAALKVHVRGKSTTITVSGVGDVIIGGDPRIKSALMRSTERSFYELIAKNGMDYPFRNVRDIFLKDDVTIINLEGTLTSANNFAGGKPHVFRGQGQYTKILKDSGVDVCTMANNHTYDFGKSGFEQTAANLTRNGILHCYHINSELSSNDSQIIEKDGVRVKIGYIGFQQPIAAGTVRNKVRNLKREGDCDLVVASFHWTSTPEWQAFAVSSDSPKFAATRALARAAVQGGADLVLGHHRHVISGIEQYQGKYIVYDLANFIVGIKHKNENGSMIFQQTFRVDETGYVEDAGIKIIPCTTTTETETYPGTLGMSDGFGDVGAPINNWQPAILTGAKAEELLSRLRSLSNTEIP